MTNIEYLKRKNNIIKKVTGLILIPEDQIVELDGQPELNMELLTGELNAAICTYCSVFYSDDYEQTNRTDGIDNDCAGCPMEKAGNRCNDADSSWRKVTIVWSKNATKKDIKKIKNLAILYSKKRVHTLTNDEIYKNEIGDNL